MKLIAAIIVNILILGSACFADDILGTPEDLDINSVYGEGGPFISDDCLSLYFHSEREGGYGNVDLWETRRNSVYEDWQVPVNLGPNVNTPAGEFNPCLSKDGLSLYFSSDRAGGYGGYDLWIAKRESVNSEWGSPENLGNNINSSYSEITPCISNDGLILYFSDCDGLAPRNGGEGDSDIWAASRKSVSDSWEKAYNLGKSVNSKKMDINPSLSSDGLILFFCSDRDGGQGWNDIWAVAKDSADGKWSIPINPGSPVNSKYNDNYIFISSDGKTICIGSQRYGGKGGSDIWQIQVLSGESFVKMLDH